MARSQLVMNPEHFSGLEIRTRPAATDVGIAESPHGSDILDKPGSSRKRDSKK